MSTVVTTQVAALRQSSRRCRQIMISPFSSPITTCRRMAMEPAGSETSEDAECEGERNSKIRARQSTRNEQVYTAMAADGRASATREQQVSGRNPHQTTRPNPVGPRR